MIAIKGLTFLSTGQIQALSSPRYYTEWLASRVPGTVTRHGIPALAYLVLALVVGWPMLGGDFPVGVDTPTFLHLGWVTQQAVTGGLDSPFTDNYWYGGFPYLQAYPPLSYGVVGLVSAVPMVDLITVYRVALIVVFLALGLATYGLALEMGIRRWASVLAGALTMISYPVLASFLLWGWFSSLAALPIAMGAYILLERSLRMGSWKTSALGGVLLALAILTHHMTAFAFGLGLIVWFLFHLVARTYHPYRLARFSGIFVGVALLVSLSWAIPFLTYWFDVGFERPVPGNWAFPLDSYRRALIDSGRIGDFRYPSYLGTLLVPLGAMGLAYSLLAGRRLAAMASIALVLLWFSLGAKGNVLYYYPPFKSLDVARFHLYAAPFLAVGVVALVSGFINLVAERWSLLARGRWPLALASLAMVLVMAFPLMDAWNLRGKVEPYRIEPEVQSALDWISQRPEASAQEDLVFTMGFWTWGSFLVPYETQRPLAAGWYDEGARNWKTVQRLRLMAFNANVDPVVAHQSLIQLNAKYVVVYDWYPFQHPWLFQEEFQNHPELFEKQAEWGEGPGGKIMAFEVLTP